MNYMTPILLSGRDECPGRLSMVLAFVFIALHYITDNTYVAIMVTFGCEKVKAVVF